MEQQTQLARLGLFDAKVPRYTSYPTAPHFANDVRGGDFRQWIEAIPAGNAISLYVHVPFCRRLCWFCACRTQGTSTNSPLRAYLDTLKAELDLLARDLPAGVTLSRLHFGGGTPTLLPAAMLTELTEAIYSFLPLGPNAEFSVEIDPNEIDDGRLDALAAAGMTRASIGVQDFDPEIQKIIGREQSYEITEAAVNGLRALGVLSLNADILYGLPNQTDSRIADSVQKLLSLSPDRVALYGYAHVPWMAKRQSMIPSDALPTPQERLGLFETARELFVWDGYAEIGIDHFAVKGDGLETAQRSGRLKRNFQGYTDDTAEVLIGVGASSISRFPQGYAQNAPATSAHTQKIREGQYSTARGHRFSKVDVIRGRMIEALMCDFSVSVAEVAALPGASRSDVSRWCAEVAAQFPGFVRFADGRLDILPEGRPLTRMVARAFDAYDLSRAGHSSAV
ncbi:oxygen-independent coproporphyrinogen III oxidase [Pseudoruegeria sp. SHC-113]|uniref:oxygen-independent coproporphyrinogen III oxidase n=1 Tax=Pseudoruegeria sp. SHC-113 TaxID=2855439 RepID=UPI0021BAFD89|nr:oxygen-independent coproporphyrinogen III oxidase [Pseudoruegeria sp. SHC-113]MCT8161769.1 oxygen-independent coproporphyrinogen III oxidase [Pseudoruegeria sp. SHC-113]